MDRTGSGSCPMAGFGTKGVETLCAAARGLVGEMGLMETGCEDGRWIELAQDRDQWQAVVLGLLELCVLLPES